VAGDLFPTTRNVVHGTASHAPKNVATRLVQSATNFTTKGELLVAIDKPANSLAKRTAKPRSRHARHRVIVHHANAVTVYENRLMCMPLATSADRFGSHAERFKPAPHFAADICTDVMADIMTSLNQRP
jgi:hypothetical protein